VPSSKERRESERKLTSTVLHQKLPQSLSLPLGVRLLTPYVNFRSLRSSCAASKDLFTKRMPIEDPARGGFFFVYSLLVCDLGRS